jgi:hypothetical protein
VTTEHPYVPEAINHQRRVEDFPQEFGIVILLPTQNPNPQFGALTHRLLGIPPSIAETHVVARLARDP